MIEKLRRKAFPPDSRKGLELRIGIAEAAQLLGCSTHRIRMAEEDGRLPAPPPSENGRRPGYDIAQLLRMREVLGASPRRRASDLFPGKGRPAAETFPGEILGAVQQAMRSWKGRGIVRRFRNIGRIGAPFSLFRPRRRPIREASDTPAYEKII